ncbi:K(+)-transporting ATPase subunit F [Alicyclobacillus dauci]
MWVLLLIAIALAIYLIYVVFHPEQF